MIFYTLSSKTHEHSRWLFFLKRSKFCVWSSHFSATIGGMCHQNYWLISDPTHRNAKKMKTHQLIYCYRFEMHFDDSPYECQQNLQAEIVCTLRRSQSYLFTSITLSLCSMTYVIQCNLYLDFCSSSMSNNSGIYKNNENKIVKRIKGLWKKIVPAWEWQRAHTYTWTIHIPTHTNSKKEWKREEGNWYIDIK